MRLYLNEKPRAFIITKGNYALIIRHPFPEYRDSYHRHHIGVSNPNDPNAGKKNHNTINKVVVEFLKKDNLNLAKYRDITPSKTRNNKQILGFLGLLNVKSNIYLGFITQDQLVALPMEGENINKIKSVDFYCLNNDEFDEYDDSHLNGLNHVNEKGEHISQPKEYPAGSVRKLLADGTFYYSNNFDITTNIQGRGINENNFSDHKFQLHADVDQFGRFMWNKFLNSELIQFRDRLTFLEQKQFDQTQFLITIIRGYAQTVNTICGGSNALLTLITRQACDKSGPLFGAWGCDDNGAVANYAETEVIVYTKRFILLYVIVRGNVPIYWEIETSSMKRNLITTQKIKKLDLPRSFEASHHAFTRHFDSLIDQYGEVQIIDTMPIDSKDYKGELNREFKRHIAQFNLKKDSIDNSKSILSEVLGSTAPFLYRLGLIDIPISTATVRKYGYSASNLNSIVPLIENTVIDFGALFYDIEKGAYIGKQVGVFRVTSFASSSKANFISKIISQEVLELAFRDFGIEADRELLSKHARLWSENNHYINKIVDHFSSSSDKLKSSSSTSTKHAVKSHISKMYLQGVVETKPKETSMLKLLGSLQDQVSVTLHNPIHDYINRELKKRNSEFCSLKTISLFASTFNVNGHCYKDPIQDWLFPRKHQITKSYDLVFIGIQEIVELTPGKMVNTDLTNRLFWEKKINVCLNEYNPEKVTYVSLWSSQIGGIASFLYIKNNEIDNISNLEGSFKKTGMGGISANKGGLAVSFNYSKTEICLVSSHLAAGLHNTVERHQNYKTIAQGIQFSKNRKIKNHDVVVWLGDFNYRIGLANEQVKPLIEKRQFSKLFEYDQLNIEMANGESFPFFDEMEIQFPPTYKFDNGTKTYDTSEKQRIPAWTDRILSLSQNKIIKQTVYDSVEDIIFSDHRPVYSNFEISVNIVNEMQKKNISQELYENYRTKVGDINEILTNNNIMFLFEDDKVLPPPSSDIHKWWLEGSKAAKISIPELKQAESSSDGNFKVFNPKSPINPFDVTDEPEFITKEELLKTIVDQKLESISGDENEDIAIVH